MNVVKGQKVKTLMLDYADLLNQHLYYIQHSVHQSVEHIKS